MTQSTLIAHCGADYTHRDGLRAIETPEPMGRWHKPIAHIELVETLEETLADQGIKLAREEYAVQRGGKVIFGTMDFDPTSKGLVATDPTRGYSLGLRGANDQTMPLEIAVGDRIFVCDNLAFAPGLISMKRKHTIGLDLKAELGEAVTRYVGQTRDMDALIDRARERELRDEQAKGLILDAFVRHDVMPVRLLPHVTRLYFDTPEDATDISEHPRTLWALHNAFTREARKLKPARRFDATAKLGGLLALAKADLN